MYGSSTQMVITYGHGVHLFTLDPSVGKHACGDSTSRGIVILIVIGEFLLTTKNMKIPEKPKTIFSINEGNSIYWNPPVKRFVEKVKNGEKPYSGNEV